MQVELNVNSQNVPPRSILEGLQQYIKIAFVPDTMFRSIWSPSFGKYILLIVYLVSTVYWREKIQNLYDFV